jgi:hypothetical protein
MAYNLERFLTSVNVNTVCLVVVVVAVGVL